MQERSRRCMRWRWTGVSSSAEIEVMLAIENTNLTLVIPDESIAASLRK